MALHVFSVVFNSTNWIRVIVTREGCMLEHKGHREALLWAPWLLVTSLVCCSQCSTRVRMAQTKPKGLLMQPLPLPWKHRMHWKLPACITWYSWCKQSRAGMVLWGQWGILLWLDLSVHHETEWALLWGTTAKATSPLLSSSSFVVEGLPVQLDVIVSDWNLQSADSKVLLKPSWG